MIVHQRMISPGFWTDNTLIDNFEPEGRLFYAGLWALADDSGCLEYAASTIKRMLFPDDSKVTVKRIEGWIEKMLRSQIQFLVHYIAKGKSCLFIRTFHEHQRPPNPTRPTCPLPTWVEWIPNDKNRYRAGKYVVDSDALSAYLTGCTQAVDSQFTACAQPVGDVPENGQFELNSGESDSLLTGCAQAVCDRHIPLPIPSINNTLSPEENTGGNLGTKASGNLKFEDFVEMTQIELDKLTDAFGPKVRDDYIHKLNIYIGKNSAKARKDYKNHYFVILNWLNRDGIKPRVKSAAGGANGSSRPKF